MARAQVNKPRKARQSSQAQLAGCTAAARTAGMQGAAGQPLQAAATTQFWIIGSPQKVLQFRGHVIRDLVLYSRDAGQHILQYMRVHTGCMFRELASSYSHGHVQSG